MNKEYVAKVVDMLNGVREDIPKVEAAVSSLLYDEDVRDVLYASGSVIVKIDRSRSVSSEYYKVWLDNPEIKVPFIAKTHTSICTETITVTFYIKMDEYRE